MPSTIREIAEACGCNKQTVVNNLRVMNLWYGHVDVTQRPFVVDDYAAQQVAAVLSRGGRAGKREAAQEAAQDRDEVIEALRRRIAELEGDRERLARQNEALTDKVDGMTGQVAELAAKVSTQAAAIKALPAPADVDLAREQGTAEGEQAGAVAEREKIASMGWWQRRKYLRG